MQVAKKAAGIRMVTSGLAMSVELPPSAAGALPVRRMQQQQEEEEEERSPYEVVRRLANGNAVVVFSMSGCCMCTVAKRLLFGLGVGPTVVELDHHSSGRDIQEVLFQLATATGGTAKTAPPTGVPAVFVGGKFLGGIETLMACHINGTLIPLLKEAGALWL